MFLKSLEIFGFKSFADRERIDFAEGITALLGPNGMGKSNVVDAVKWVLGEQSVKNMRAEKMEDVIFMGTDTRKPLNVAEVALTLSNEQNILPLDAPEITIKRRLYRSGENEFFINSSPARLKDVRELFWDTGIGKAAYSVMEQGKIDQILSSRPEERRYLFEEAAGITRFKAKRAVAERKLEQTAESLKQLEIVLAEVKRSYDALKVQADKTVRYRQCREDIFRLELDIQLLRLKAFTRDRDKAQGDAKTAGENRDKIRGEIDAINATLSENMDAVNGMEQRQVELQREIFGLEKTRIEKVQRAQDLASRRTEVKEKLSQLEGRKASLEERIGSLREDIDEQEAGLHDKKRRIEQTEGDIQSFENNIGLASNRITENDRRAADLQKRIGDLDRERTALQTDLDAVTENIVTELDSRLKDAGYSGQAHGAARERLAALVARLKTLIAGRQGMVSDAAQAAENLSPQFMQSFIEKTAAAFREAEHLVAQLEEAAAEYGRLTPAFIDEFLSPEGIITQKRGIDRNIRGNLDKIEDIKAQITALQGDNSALVGKIEEYRATLEARRISKAEMQAQMRSAEEQIRLIRRDLITQETSLRDTDGELASEQGRAEDIREQTVEIEGEIASIEHKGRAMMGELEELERDLALKNSAVAGKRESLEKKTAEAASWQAKIEKLTMETAVAETDIRNIKETFKETHSRELMEFEERMFIITANPADLREQLAAARQTLRDLGNVNLMAPEEFNETKERHAFLSGQIDDIKKSRDDIERVAQEMRAEATELFLETYNKIKKNFHNMFRRLFGGGRGELRLIDPENVLESGIEIFAQPPGKRLENISLLSGGERSMTAVALLFATYMVRPSPFCLLDEIDAALDDENVSRFVNILREFSHVSQYFIITHNKKTAVSASTLIGITMEESGVSKKITMRLVNEDAADAPSSVPDIAPFEEEDVPPEEGVVIPARPGKRITA